MTTPKVNIEPLASVVRVWIDPARGYGDPYDWVATVRWLSQTEVEILGYVKPITRPIFRAVAAECYRLGIRRILTIRYRNGTRREKWITL